MKRNKNTLRGRAQAIAEMGDSIRTPSGNPVFVSKIVPTKFRKRRLVDLSVNGSNGSSFSNPSTAISNLILNALDPTKQPGKCRSVSPASAITSSPTDHHRTHGKVDWRTAIVRQKRLGLPVIKGWRASHTNFGWFCLLRDGRILLQTWTRENGWSEETVPASGVNTETKTSQWKLP